MEHISKVVKRIEEGTAKQQSNITEPIMTHELSKVKCSICKDAGFIHPIKEGGVDYTVVIPCKCRNDDLQKERQDRLLKYCELPPESERFDFNNFDDRGITLLKKAKEDSKALAEGNPGIKWITLMGHVDSGKTHLLIAVCRRWLERGIPAKYVYVPLMLDWLREGFTQERMREYGGGLEELPFERRMRLLLEVPLLALDDLGLQVPKPWAMERITTLIDSRIMNGLPLIITTNKRLDELPGDEEGRIRSRLMRYEQSKVFDLFSVSEYSLEKGRIKR